MTRTPLLPWVAGGVPLLLACGSTSPGAQTTEPANELSQAVLGTATALGPSGVTSCTPTLEWTRVAGAYAFDLDLKDMSTNPLHNRRQWASPETAGCGPSGSPICRRVADALQPGSYRMRVRAYTYSPPESTWSNAVFFDVLPPAPAEGITPVQKGWSDPPAPGLVSTNPVFQWKAVPEAEIYRLRVPPDSVFTLSPADAGCGAGSSEVCTYHPDVRLPFGQQWSWTIDTWNAANPSWCSAIGGYFTIVASGPGMATLQAPSGAVVDPHAFSWYAVAEATSYRLWVNDGQRDRTIDRTYSAEEVGCSAGTGLCTANVEDTLAIGGGKWWVQTLSPTQTGPWSLVQTFTKGTIGPPTPISPNGPADSNHPAYTWSAVPGAMRYRLRVGGEGLVEIFDGFVTPEQAGCAAGDTCSYTPRSGVYTCRHPDWCQPVSWWVNANGGTWAGPTQFTVPWAPRPYAPNNWWGPIATNRPTYSFWGGFAESYELWVNDSSAAPKIRLTYSAAAADCPVGGSGETLCSVTPDTALASGPATWWIRETGQAWTYPHEFIVP